MHAVLTSLRAAAASLEANASPIGHCFTGAATRTFTAQFGLVAWIERNLLYQLDGRTGGVLRHYEQAMIVK